MTLKDKKQLQKESLLRYINKEEVSDYLKHHKYVDTISFYADRYQCSQSVLAETLKELGIKKSVADAQAMRLSTNLQKYGAGTKPRKPIIDRDLLYQFYITDFLSIDQIICKFENKYTKTQIRDALHMYNIKRDKKNNPNYKWSESTKQRHEWGFIQKYGVNNPMKCSKTVQKGQQTKAEKYGQNWGLIITQKAQTTYRGKTGLNNPFQDIDHIEESLQEKFGVSHNSQRKEVRDKIKSTKLKRYGHSGYNNPDKIKQTNLERYGVEYLTKLPSMQERIKQTNLQKYGVTNTLLLPQANNKQRVHSKPNDKFHSLLEQRGLVYQKDFEREFVIKQKIFDFKIGNYLIEIDPSSTHNSTWNPWIKGGIDPYYHQIKSRLAYENGYRCIHVWDWMDYNKVIDDIINHKYSMQISFIEPQPHYYSFKTKNLCNPDIDKCVTIYDDGSVEI